VAKNAKDKVYEGIEKALDYVRDKIQTRIEKTSGYMAPRLELKRDGLAPKLKAILSMYATAATLGFFKPSFKEASEKLKAFSDALVKGLEVAINPPIQTADEGDALGDAVLEFLGHLLRSRNYREKVAKTGKIAIVITLDISKANMTPEDKREALFWGLVFPGLHREGKV
jgi:hypothetical protein